MSKVASEATGYYAGDFNFNTQAGLKEAADALLKTLGTRPEAECPAMFVALEGPTLIQALKDKGLAMTVNKFAEIGIKF